MTGKNIQSWSWLRSTDGSEHEEKKVPIVQQEEEEEDEEQIVITPGVKKAVEEKKELTVCKYGASCTRKNPQHFEGKEWRNVLRIQRSLIQKNLKKSKFQNRKKKRRMNLHHKRAMKKPSQRRI